MTRDEVNEKLTNRFCEILFKNVTIETALKEEIIDYYMKEIESRFDYLYKDKTEFTADLVDNFIAKCLNYDEVFEKPIEKRWSFLYSMIIREKFEKYDSEIIDLVNRFEKNEISNIEEYKGLFSEIKDFFATNKDFIYENDGQEFYDTYVQELLLDIDYLCGNLKERNKRIPRFM